MPEEAAPAPRRTDRKLSSLTSALAATALVVALVAVGLAAWALVRSASAASGAGEYSESQRAEAKVRVCAAVDAVRRGVSRNTNLLAPGGPEDITGNLAVAANARLALFDGGQYLIDRLDPATPPELADAVRGFANTLMDIGAAATAGALDSDPDQAKRLQDADAANARLGQLCA